MSWDNKDGWGSSSWESNSGWSQSGWRDKGWQEDQSKRRERWQKGRQADGTATGETEKLTLFEIISRLQNAYAWEKSVLESNLDRSELEQFQYNFRMTEYWSWFRTAFRHGFVEVLMFTLLLPIAVLVELKIVTLWPNGDKFYELFSLFLLFSVNIAFTALFVYMSHFVVGSLTRRMFSPLAWGRAIPLYIKAGLLFILALLLTREHLPPDLVWKVAENLTTIADKGLDAKAIYERIYENLPQLREGFAEAGTAIALFASIPLLIYKFKKPAEVGFRGWIKRLLKKECKLDTSRLKKKELHFGCGIRIFPELPTDKSKIRPVFQHDSERNTHTDIIGTTGVGKTRLAESLIEQDIKMGNSVIVIDPKPDWDLFSRVWSATVEAGRTEDFIFISLLHPHLSSGINPLKFYVYPDEVVSTIVATIQSREQFYIDIAREMTTLIVEGLYFLHSQEYRRRKQFTYSEILRYISQDGLKELAEQIKAYRSRAPEKVEALLANYQQAINSPTDYFNKVVTTLRTNVSNFSHGLIGKIVGKADDNLVIERLESGKPVVCYVMTGAQTFLDKANQLSRVLLAMINNMAGRLNASGVKLNPPLRIHVDEAYTALFHGIEHLFDKARSTGIGMVMYHQSIAQYYEAVGKELADSILDNINTYFIMRVNKRETQEFAARMTGYKLSALPTFSVEGHAGMFPDQVFRIQPEFFSEFPPRIGMLVRNGAKEGTKVVDLLRTPLIKPPKFKVEPERLLSVSEESRIVEILKDI